MLTVPIQLRWWSIGYLVVALLVTIGAISNRTWTFEDELGTRQHNLVPGEVFSSRTFLWIVLAASASVLWLALANYLSQEVAAIPFLWVLPLTLYLLSFVLCFGWDGWYRAAIFRWLLPAAWIGIVWRTGLSRTTGDLRVDIAVLLIALFILCLFCHGELARAKPAPRQQLAFFYLMAATGGRAGRDFCRTRSSSAVFLLSGTADRSRRHDVSIAGLDLSSRFAGPVDPFGDSGGGRFCGRLQLPR